MKSKSLIYFFLALRNKVNIICINEELKSLKKLLSCILIKMNIVIAHNDLNTILVRNGFFINQFFHHNRVTYFLLRMFHNDWF